MLSLLPQSWDALDWIFCTAMVPVICLALLFSYDSLFPGKDRFARH